MYVCHTGEIMLEAVVAITEHLYDDRGRLAATLAYIFSQLQHLRRSFHVFIGQDSFRMSMIRTTYRRRILKR